MTSDALLYFGGALGVVAAVVVVAVLALIGLFSIVVPDTRDGYQRLEDRLRKGKRKW